MSFEKSLVWHASPTLANIKIANLYNFKFESRLDCENTLDYFNSMMNPKGLYIELLRQTEDFYLIFVFRKSYLQKGLENEKIQEFLKELGYPIGGNVEEYLEFLKSQLIKGKEFPHEIGVFLGYPLSDVKAFIETKGQNCITCGEWKVYGDEEKAKCMFCKYKHCKEVYVSVYEAGKNFKDMLVSA